MRQLAAIVRRETGAFFHSAMAPVALTGFLLAVGLFFTIFLLGYSDMSATALKSPRSGNYLNLAEGLFRPLVSDMTLFLLLLMPAVTMRLFAPDYRSGRYDLTASWPVPDHLWILGKWLSAVGVGAVMILSSSALFLVVRLLGQPEPGPVLAAFAGLLLLVACLAGWGVLASVLFSHQMVAYFLGFALSFSLFIIGALERYLPGPLGRICQELSFLTHFERFSRGVLDSRDVLFFLLMALIPLLAATAVLAGRRLPARRQLVLWSPTLIGLVLAVAITVLGQWLPWTADLTGNRRYSLAPQTLRILDGLPAELAAQADSLASATGETAPDHVQIYAFYQRNDPAREVMEVLLEACQQRTRAVRYELVDPEADLERVRQYGVTVARTLVIEAAGRRASVLQPEESALIGAVYRVATGTRPGVGQLLGHGEHLLDSDERSGYSSYDLVLADQGYDLRPLFLSDTSFVPAGCEVVVVAGPRTQPAAGELAALEKHLERGGAILVLVDPPTPSGWVEWLARWRVGVTGDVIISADRAGDRFGVGARTAVVTDGYSDHEIALGLQGVATLFPLAQALQESGEPDPRVAGAILLRSSDLSWGETDPATRFAGRPRFDEGADLPGPLPLGMVLEVTPAAGQDRPGRLVVLGNSEFLNNSNINLGGNRDLLLNILGWLAREETLIQLRGRDPLSQPVILSLTEKKIFGWGAVLGWPLLVGSLAVGFMLRHRRNLAGRR